MLNLGDDGFYTLNLVRKRYQSVKVVDVKPPVIEEALNHPDFTVATYNTVKGCDQQRKFGLCFSFVKHIFLLEFLCP